MHALRFTVFWMTLGAILLATVVYLCLEPHPVGGAASVHDKLAHFLAFFALTGWFGALVERRYFWLVALGMLAVGGLIEIAQGLMALGRTAEMLDFLADATGVLAGIALNLPIRDSWLARLERWLLPT